MGHPVSLEKAMAVSGGPSSPAHVYDKKTERFTEEVAIDKNGNAIHQGEYSFSPNAAINSHPTVDRYVRRHSPDV